MEIDHIGPGAVAWTLSRDAHGAECAVIVLKRIVTWDEGRGEVASVSDDPPDLIFADRFAGEPGVSAPLLEYDFAPYKAQCDVLVAGPALAPHGEPVKKLQAGVKIGSWQKILEVQGQRKWEDGLLGLSATPAEPFLAADITYGEAFGGIDPGSSKGRAFRANPVGRGFAPSAKASELDGTLLPNTSELGAPVTNPRQTYKPMALAPIGRAWEGRVGFAGTYDDKWLEERFPFLPDDFDERYFQSTASDQQIAHPTGGEEVVTIGLSASGRQAFKLPDLNMPLLIERRSEDDLWTTLIADTIVIEAAARRAHITQRARVPIKRDAFELTRAVIGSRSRAWHRARETGKVFHPGLGAVGRGAPS